MTASDKPASPPTASPQKEHGNVTVGQPPGRAPRRFLGRRSLRTAALAVLLAGGTLGLYGITRAASDHAGHSGACARSLDLAVAADPLVRGEIAAFVPASRANDLQAIAFDDAQGHKTTLAAFKGRTVLLNLWATWCVPCRAEMPALDKLQAQLGSDVFTVVPVNIDQSRLERARGFFAEIGATSLPYYADASADVLRALNGKGLPTTVLVGRDGCEIGTMAGPAQWDSLDAKDLIGKVAAPPPA